MEISRNSASSKFAQSSQPTLHALDDECLFELFTHFTDIEDVLELGSTCKRFLGIAQKVYCSKFQKIDHSGQMICWPIKKIERYLKHFGEFCETFDSNDSKELCLLGKYCKNLTKLRCNSQWTCNKHLKSIFPNLVEFETSGDFYYGAELFGDNSPLQKLTLVDCDVTFPAKHFPNLRHVELKAITWYSSATIDNFFKLNTQITRLELCHGTQLKSAVRHLENLEEFTYLIDEYAAEGDYEGLKNFTKLKKLTLNMWKDEYEPDARAVRKVLLALWRANPPLEHLTLDAFVDFSYTAFAITRFPALRTLVLKEISCSMLDEDDEELVSIGRIAQMEHIICEAPVLSLRLIRVFVDYSREKLRSALFIISPDSPYQCETPELEEISAIADERELNVEIIVQVSITITFLCQ